jgi:hypothetical protein
MEAVECTKHKIFADNLVLPLPKTPNRSSIPLAERHPLKRSNEIIVNSNRIKVV